MFDPETKTYFFFIIYLIVLLYVNIIALYDTFSVSISELRTFNNIVVPLLTLYFLAKFKLSKIMYIIVGLWTFGILRFWIFNKELIYYFINRTPQNVAFVDKQMKYNLGIVENTFMIFVEIYCLYYVFSA